jgi:hypothetical protein
MKTSEPPAPSLRARGQLRAIAGAVLVTMFTLGGAAAQLLPGPRLPTPRQVMADELAAIAQQRRVRIAELQDGAPADRCHPPSARELARLLVMDGQGPDARRFADTYEQRCGEDPIVRKWRDAPDPRRRR